MLHILAEVAPLKIADGSRPVLRASSAQDRRLNGVAGQRWWPGITKLPSLAIPLFDGDFTEEVAPGSASFTLRLEALANLDASVRAYRWAGAAVSLYAIDGGLSLNAAGSYDVASLDAARIFKGRVESFAIDGGALSLTAEVDQEPFNKDVLQLTYAGTGEAEGGEDLKERLKPWIFGRALNVEPILINSVDNVVQFSAYPIQGISALYERGSSFGPSIGNYPSYAQLVAATIPAGRWATCHALGMARLGAPPYGIITGDVDGDNVSGFIRRTGAIIRRVALASGVALDQIDTASLDALDAAVPYDINLVLTEQISVLDLARRLALPCNAQAGLDFQGRLFAVRPAIGSPNLTLDAQGRQLPPVRRCQEADVSAPYKRIMFGANRSWRVHTFDEIAFDAELVDRGDYDPDKTYRRGNIVSLPNGSRWLYVSDTPKKGSLPSSTNANWEQMTGAITAGNITYEDGTPVEDLKPAEPGATDGASPAEKDQLAQLEADTAAAQVRMEQAEQDIADLFDTYGDSASAAQSALAAAQSAQTAQDAEDNAKAARDLAQDARAAADAAVSDASDYADASSLSATASNTAKTAAETARTAAETARTQAQTAKTDAQTAFNNSATARDASVAAKQASELARDNAQTYASNANGSATAAAAHASTASTKATEAGNSATAAAASVVSAASALENSSYLDAGLISDLTGTIDGWSPSGSATLTASGSGMQVAVTGADPYISRTALDIDGARFTRVYVTLTRTANRASGSWDGSLYWSRTGHGWSGSYRANAPMVPIDPVLNQRVTLVYDMPSAIGGTDWSAGTVTGLRLDLDQGAGGAFLIHSIRVAGPDALAPAKDAQAAATSASAAAASAGTAGQSATAAQQSATTASTRASEASTSASQASTSANSAAGSASAAQTSAGAAAQSATNAGQSANAASNSAQTASTKATEAGQHASAAQTSATTATTKAGEASTSATQAASSATTAQGHASNASNSASAAANSATSAGNSATAASGSAQTASTKATEAGNSASAAAGSAVSAASSYSSAVGVVLTTLPEKYTAASDPYFSTEHVGAPSSVPPVFANATAPEGTPVYQIILGANGGASWAQRGVFPATSGRIYEVEYEYRIPAVSGSVDVRAYVRSLDGSYASITSSAVSMSALSGRRTLTYLVAASGADMNWNASAVWLRAFINITTGADGSITIQPLRIRVSDVTEREASKASASAAATSASTASTKASEAGQSANSATQSANTASTRAGEALASQQAAASSASDALGYRNSASSSATLAAQSKSDAANSATAAAGSASSAATHATNAGQSASAASSSALAANATFANLKNTVANQSQALPYDFKDGNAFWTNDRTGAPDARTGATGALITNDPLLGQCWEITDWSAAGHNILTRGVVPVIAGRFYEVRARFRVTSGSPADFNAIASGMTADYTATEAAFRGGPAITAGNSGVFEAVALFSDTTANGATAFTSDAVFARFGLRLAQSKAVTVRVQSIRVADVTEKLAAANSATAASGSASNAAGSATAAGSSASAAQGSATTASTKAAEAANSASAAATSASSASSSSNSAAQSASAAESSRLTAEVAATNAGYVDAGYVADFTGSALNGFTATNATLTPSASGLRMIGGSGDAQLYRTGLSFSGARFTRVVVELTRTVAGSLWDGTLFWTTSSHGWSGSYRAKPTSWADPALNVPTTLTFDMPNALDGASDWLSSTITGIRFDTDNGAGGEFLIRSIRIIGPDGLAPAKAAQAAASSASSAAGSATAAGNSAGAAQTSATNAATSAGQASTSASQASTSASQASTSATNAAGSASTASTAATNAAQSATNAGNSASAAAGSASTATTKASEAANSANSAAASAVSANSTYNAMIQSQAASPVLPYDFSDGLNQWTNDRFGLPQNVTKATGTVIDGDGIYGRCADFNWSAAGDNVLTRGTVPLTPGRVYEVTARFRVRNGDGNYSFTLIGAWMDAAGAEISWSAYQTTAVTGGATVEITALFGTSSQGGYLWPSAAIYGRFGLRNNGAESGMSVRAASIRVTDVTDRLAASNSASAASTSASNAATSAGQAGASATAASGHANTAQTKAGEAASSASAASSSAAAASSSASSASQSASQASTYRGQAESAATTATTQATIATNAAAAASSSATVMAQVAAASINPNPVFSDWPTGQTLPSNYSLWGGSTTVTKATGAQSPYAPRTAIASTTAADGGGLQTQPFVATQVIQNGMWLVLEVDARRVSGDIRGACAMFRIVDSAGSAAQNHFIDLYADADTSEAVGGNVNTGLRRWRKLVKVEAASAYGWRLYMMNRYSGASSYTSAATANQIEWHRVSFRPATDQEIAAKKATADISALSASVAQQATTLSTLSTQYASLSDTVSAQGVTVTQQASAIASIEDGVETLFAKWGFELDVNGYVSGMVMNNNGQRADLTFRTDRARFITPSGKGGYWNLDFDSQGRPTQTIGDDASGVTIELGYLA